MTVIKLKGVNKTRKRLSDGTIKTFYYHRATGKRLSGLPGSAEFLDAYAEADRPLPPDTDTIAVLIREYLASPKFGDGPKANRESSQRESKRMLTPLEAEFGTMPVTALATPKVIGEFIDYQEEIGIDRPREADNRLTTLSAVFSYAKRKGRIARNPLDGFERLYAGDRSDLVWVVDDITKFMESAPIELQRALILAIHTGQRYGDLVRLRWSDYDGDYIRLKQSKTKAFVRVKVTAALKRMLDSTPKKCPFILARVDGRPWFTEKNNKALSQQWIGHMKACGLFYEGERKAERLHFNDLRGTAVTLLAMAGCTIPEIVSITGHTLESANRILEKYLARTQTLSDAAMMKFENAPATDFANRLQTSEVT